MRSDNMPRPFAPEHSETDIVESLTLEATNFGGVQSHVGELLSNSVDEIQRLRNRIDGLLDQHFRDSNELRSLCQQRDDFKAESDKLRQDVAQLRDLLEELEVCREGSRVAHAELKELREELAYCRHEMKAVWDHVQKVSPWSESNDMSWSDEVGTGIGFLVQKRNELSKKVSTLTDARDHIRRLESEAAEYVELPIIQRTHFTGEEPYVGWKGIGLALTETLDRYDALKAKIEAAPVVCVEIDAAGCYALGVKPEDADKVAALIGKNGRLVVEDE